MVYGSELILTVIQVSQELYFVIVVSSADYGDTYCCINFVKMGVAWFMQFLYKMMLNVGYIYGLNRVIRISPFANRLSFDSPPAVQRLRCLANYEALRFSSPILTLGETLVARMKERSANYGGKYISVHLRFEEVCLDQLLV